MNAAPKQSLRQRVSALRNLGPFLRQVWNTSPALTLATAALRLMRALLPVTMLYVAKLVIDAVVALAQAPGEHDDLLAAWQDGLLQPLLWLIALEFGLALLSDLLGRAVNLVDSLLSERYVNEVSVSLMKHAATLDLEDFEDSELQDQLERARRQTMGRSPLMGQLFGQAQDFISVIAFATGLAVYAPWLIGLMVVALLPAFLGEMHFNALGYSLDFGRTPERRELDYVRQTGASVETAKEVKIFGLENFLIERYRTLAQKFYSANRKLALRRAIWGAALTLVGTLAYYAAYAYLAWRTVRGDFSVGDLTFLAGSFLRLRGLLEGLLSGFSQVASQALYLDDLYSFFGIKPEILSRPDSIRIPKPVRRGFVFENVGFQYPGASRWAVRNLSFTLHAGESVALVGENGAGKTSVVKLLARLYDPDEGRILLDGVDLRDYDLDDLRANIGVIFQDFVRFNLSARDNIAVGRIDARADLPRIEDAARRSLADAVIAKLPKGYDQPLGRRFASGTDLSGGEWQKLAIARAYMRQAQVMILDEPTAALDARSEYEVFERFKELSEGRTTVLISHRFSTVRMADRILVLEQGTILESGSHEQLLGASGRYAELFNLQAEGYR